MYAVKTLGGVKDAQGRQYLGGSFIAYFHAIPACVCSYALLRQESSWSVLSPLDLVPEVAAPNTPLQASLLVFTLSFMVSASQMPPTFLELAWHCLVRCIPYTYPSITRRLSVECFGHRQDVPLCYSTYESVLRCVCLFLPAKLSVAMLWRAFAGHVTPRLRSRPILSASFLLSVRRMINAGHFNESEIDRTN